MRLQTLLVAALCAAGTLALAALLLSGCYLGQEGTALLSTTIEAGVLELPELDAGNGYFPGENDASLPVDVEPQLELDAGGAAAAELLELDAGDAAAVDAAAELVPDCGLPWELGLCVRGGP